VGCQPLFVDGDVHQVFERKVTNIPMIPGPGHGEWGFNSSNAGRVVGVALFLNYTIMLFFFFFAYLLDKEKRKVRKTNEYGARPGMWRIP